MILFKSSQTKPPKLLGYGPYEPSGNYKMWVNTKTSAFYHKNNKKWKLIGKFSEYFPAQAWSKEGYPVIIQSKETLTQMFQCLTYDGLVFEYKQLCAIFGEKPLVEKGKNQTNTTNGNRTGNKNESCLNYQNFVSDPEKLNETCSKLNCLLGSPNEKECFIMKGVCKNQENVEYIAKITKHIQEMYDKCDRLNTCQVNPLSEACLQTTAFCKNTLSHLFEFVTMSIFLVSISSNLNAQILDLNQTFTDLSGILLENEILWEQLFVFFDFKTNTIMLNHYGSGPPIFIKDVMNL